MYICICTENGARTHARTHINVRLVVALFLQSKLCCQLTTVRLHFQYDVVEHKHHHFKKAVDA